MAKKTLKATLSVKSINNLIKEVETYQNSLKRKCEEFVRELAKAGITVAEGNTGNFKKYITFSIETDPQEDGCKALLLATNTGIIKSEWKTLEGNKTAEVSPLLVLEFGTGLKAENPKNIPGVGTGTFPGGSHGGKPGWWWMDLNDIWHYSTGMSPKQPMYKASLRMTETYKEVAKRVFGR